MPSSDGACFVDEARRMLRLMRRVAGSGARYDTLLADYRAVADALGCRIDLEEAVRREAPYPDALAAG